MRFSWYAHFFSNTPINCEEESWEDFVEILRVLSEKEGYKPDAGDYENKFPLISSAIFGDVLERANSNVIGWDMVMLDIDDGVKTLDEILAKFTPFKYVIYSSANCTHQKLKIRICIPLHKFAPKEALHGIWWALNEWCDGVVDKQTKDKSRMHYQPARYTNKGTNYRHIFMTNPNGIELNWETLCQKFPAPPEKDKFKIKNPLRNLKRKVYLANKATPNFDINSKDCPFVYEQMIEKYRLTPAGGHHNAIYVFGLQCAYNAQKIDYPITVDELADLMKQVDEIDGGFYDEKKLLGNAVDILNYIGA